MTLLRTRAATQGALSPVSSGRDMTASSRHAAVIVAALFAMLWQSVVVGAYGHAHHHAAPLAHFAAAQAVVGAQGVAGARGATAASDDDPARQDPADCPVCWEMAHDGVFLLPDIAVFRAPEPETLWRGTLPTAHASRSGRSHAWHSRAPPRILQA